MRLLRRLLSLSPSFRSRATNLGGYALGAGLGLALALAWAGATSAQQSGSGVLPGARSLSAGGAFTGALLGPLSTCAAPAYAFSGQATTGMAGTATPSVILCVNGVGVLTSTGSAVTSTVPIILGTTVQISEGAANLLTLGLGDMLSFGGATNAFPAIRREGTTTNLVIRLADDSGNGGLIAQNYTLGAGGGIGVVSNAMIATAPTVTTAGTSPSVTASNGTAAFRVNVGTGGTATTIVMAMPAAAGGWNCFAENLTAGAANRANQRVVVQSSTTTSITVQNQTISTGAALAFTASDIVSFICTAY